MRPRRSRSRAAGHLAGLLLSVLTFAPGAWGQTVTPSSRTGANATFSVGLAVNDPFGQTSVVSMQLLFNYGLDGAGACYMLFSPSTGLVLVDDTGAPGVPPDSSGYMTNSQCRVSPALNPVFTYTALTHVLTSIAFDVNVTFAATFKGNQNMYMYSETSGPLHTFGVWSAQGTWSAYAADPPPPSNISVNPASGAGGSSIFAFRFSDVNGFGYMQEEDPLVSVDGSLPNSCAVVYRPFSHLAYLILDDGASRAAPLTIGQPGSVANGQCSLDAGASSFSGSGNDAYLNLALSFLPAFRGPKNVYMAVTDRASQSTGYQQRGSWNVDTIALTPANVPMGAGVGSGSLVVAAPAGYGWTASSNAPWLTAAASGSGNGTVAFGVTGNDSGAARTGTITVNSQAATVTQAAALGTVNVSMTPANGTGANQTFTFNVYDAAGGGDITNVQMIFNYGFEGAGACYLFYWPAANALLLRDDPSDTWLGMEVGGTDTIENSQCRVSGPGSSATGVGNGLSIVIPITFKAPFVGVQNVYMYTNNLTGTGAGWDFMGTWTGTPAPSQAPPVPGPMTPTNDTGAGANFAITSSSANGAEYIAWEQILIAPAVDGAHACYFFYYALPRTIILVSDGNVVGGGVRLGSQGILENSQCKLDVGASSMTKSGNALTLNLAITFKAAFSGAKNVYMYVNDRAGRDTPFMAVGTYTVDASQEFMLSAMQAPMVQAGGATGIATLNITGLNGFTGPVNITPLVLNYPPGVTINFPVQVPALPGTALFTVAAGANATTGAYGFFLPVFTFKATSANRTHIFSVPFHVTGVPNPPGVTLSQPQSGSVQAGQSISFSVNAYPVNGGFSSPAFLSAVGSPGLPTPAVSGNGPWTVTVQTTAQTAVQTYAFPVFAVVNGRTVASSSVTIAVTPGSPAQDFTLSLPVSAQASPAVPASFSLATTGFGGLTGTVALQQGTLPSGFLGTVSISGGGVTLGGATAVAITAGASVPATYVIPIIGTVGMKQHTAYVSVKVGTAAGGDFMLTSPGPVSVQTGGTTIPSSLGFMAPAAYTGGVTFSATGPAGGPTASFSPATVTTASGATSVTVSAVGVAASSTPYHLTITAMGGGWGHSVDLAVTVTAGAVPVLTLTLAPPPILPVSGGTVQLTLSASGASGTVAFNATDEAGVTASFGAVQYNSGVATTTLTLGVVAGRATYVLDLSAVDDAGKIATKAVLLNAGAPGFTTSAPEIYVFNDNRAVEYLYVLDSGDARLFTSCSVSTGDVSATLISTTSTTLSISYRAGTAALPGMRTVTCDFIYGGITYTRTVGGGLYVYDATPAITGVIQLQPLTAGGQAAIEIYGSNFGPNQGNLAVCPSGSNTCGASDISARITYWSTGQVNAILSAAPSANGSYDVQLASLGAAGNGFVQKTGQGASSAQSNRKGGVQAGPAAPSATISRGGQVLSGNNSDNPVVVSVGEYVQLTGAVLNLPDGVSIASHSWVVGGNRIRNYVQAVSSAAVTAFADPATATVQFYWIDGDSRTRYNVTYTGTLSDGRTISGTAIFLVVRPDPTSMIGKTTSTMPEINVSDQGENPGVISLNFGYRNDPAISFNLSEVSTVRGMFALTQLVNFTTVYHCCPN